MGYIDVQLANKFALENTTEMLGYMEHILCICFSWFVLVTPHRSHVPVEASSSFDLAEILHDLE